MSDGDNDILDVVQGVDLELRHERTLFPVTHKVQALGLVKPPFITKMSEYQLVTLAGAALGFLAGVVVCPLDVVKTRIQAQGKLNRYGLFVHAFGKIIREEGVKGLYRGVVPVTIGYLPTWTIYFTVYERAKRFYPRFLREHFGVQKDWLNHFAASLTAGSASSIAVNPIWVVKTRLMLQTGSEKVYYKSTLDAFRTMYRNEGLRVFYSGLLPSLFGLIHVGIHFPVYEALKRALHVSDLSQISHGSYHKLWRLIAASTISKVIASTVTYPHEILRTKMQMQREGDAPSVSVRKWIKTIYKKEGAGGFYAGYLTNLARTLPASAVTLVSFEYFKTYLLEISGKV